MLVYASIELSTSPNNSQFTGNSIYVPLLLFVPLYWDLMSNRTLAEYISSSAVTARILRNLSDLDLLTEKEKKRKEKKLYFWTHQTLRSSFAFGPPSYMSMGHYKSFSPFGCLLVCLLVLPNVARDFFLVSCAYIHTIRMIASMMY